jgi:hypothetical protein
MKMSAPSAKHRILHFGRKPNFRVLGIIGFVVFAHSQKCKITKEHNVSETGHFSAFRWAEGDIYWTSD